jgi:hypothetical protein
MAIFKPEVRTVEGSNVGTYNPPSVDYSGFYSNIGQSIGSSISSMFDASGGKGTTSEGDKKALALQDLTSQYQRASEIEDPTVRSVTIKNIQKNAFLEYPQYREDIKGIITDLSGFAFGGTGVDPDQLVQANTYKWATSTSEGQSAAVIAQLKSNNDPLLMDQYIKDSYLQDLSYKNKLAAAEQEAKLVEADVKKRKELFSLNARPLLQDRVNTYYKNDASPEAIAVLRQNARTQGIDETSFLIDSLTSARNQRLAEITNDINKSGIDPTTVNPESFMSGYDSVIKLFTDNKDLISRSAKTITDRDIATLAMKAESPIVAKAILDNNPVAFSQYLTLDETAKKDMENIAQYSMGITGRGMKPNVSETALGTEDIGDSPRRFAEVYKGMAPEDELIKIFNSPRDAKISLGKLGINSINTYKYDPTVPEKTEAAYRNIGAMYVTALPSIDVEGSSYKSANVRNLIGNKAFSTIESIKSTNPDFGNDLYNKMNTYASNAVKQLTDSFNINMEVIKDTETSPFILELDKNGNLSLNINPEALQNDVNLKKAMGAYRYETRGSGRSVKTVGVDIQPAETDPMKILSNYVSITEGGNSREIMDIIQSLKVLASQSKKIPPDIRSKVDPIEIIKQNVTVLSK